MIKKRRKLQEKNTVRNCAFLLVKVNPIVLENLWKIMPRFEFPKVNHFKQVRKKPVANDRAE